MKLYTTVTSERGTKGQGGNKQLNLAIYIDDRKSPRFRMFITKLIDAIWDIFYEKRSTLSRKNRKDREKAFPITYG